MKKHLFLFLFAIVASTNALFAIAKVQIGDLFFYLDESSPIATVVPQEWNSTANYYGLTDVNIPSAVSYNGVTYTVTAIDYHAFADCISLTSVMIPNSVKYIYPEAFRDCDNLKTVTVGNSLTEIWENAFDGCRRLSEINSLPNTLTSIGSSAFGGCWSLKSITIEATNPPQIPDLNGYAPFERGTTIYIPCGTLETYKEAWDYGKDFYNFKYSNSPYTINSKATNGYVSVPQDITICDETVQITASADRGCYFVRWADGNTENPRVIELTQDTTMEAIFDYLLTGKCGKDNVLTWTFEPTKMALDIIGTGALSDNYTYNYQIESVEIGDGITLVGQSAFSGCEKLKNVTIGAAVKVLEEYAFCNCSAIETITCYSQRPPTVSNYALYGLDYNTIVYVPAEYLNDYKMHDAWGLYDVRALENGNGVEETTSMSSHRKELRNGQLLILRDGKTYTEQGQEVR